METTKKDLSAEQAGKQFDAVKMMRDIRDKISSETQNMTFDELKAYIKQKLADSKIAIIDKLTGAIEKTISIWVSKAAPSEVIN